MPKPLFITYMTDLGGTSLGHSYQKVLKSECNFFVFDLLKLQQIESKWAFYIAYFKLIKELRTAVKSTVKNGEKVIFQNLKPALFTLGIWDNTNGIIISDFSHTLYQWFRDKTYKKNFRFYTQRLLYKKLYKLIALTDNLADNLHQVYGVPISRIKYVPLPLDLEYYYQKPKPTSKKPKVLFVGGHFYRKGGNHLLEFWETTLKDRCQLIIMTQNKLKSPKDIQIYNNVSKGDSLHKQLFKECDIFILPTNRDAYPVVLGEAAAASMAIITTKFALGAKNIIKDGLSGFITETPEDCIKSLLTLLDNKDLIDQFKTVSNEIVLEQFTAQKFRQAFFKAIK